MDTKKRATSLGWWRAIEERVNLLFVAFLLIAIGILLLALPLVLPGIRATSVLQVLGTGIIGAGLSALVTTVTAREAVHQQYAKEANLVRKRDYYAPLHAELKYLRERLEKARTGIDPFPLEVSASPNIFARITSGPISISLAHWSQYRQDYRADEFTDKAKALFDLVQQGAETYNQARSEAERATRTILPPHIDEAVTKLRQSPDYIAWQHDDAERRASGQSWTPPNEQTWYGAIERTISAVENNVNLSSTSQETIGTVLATWWLTTMVAPQGPYLIVLWCLAGKVEQAAAYVQTGYRQEMQNPPPALDWIKSIFEAAWPELHASAAYVGARKALQDLLKRTEAAEQVLKDGLQHIQELYEGGSPLV